MTEYKDRMIDACSSCGKRRPIWSGPPYKCKGCSDNMNKSESNFEKAWAIVKGDDEDYGPTNPQYTCAMCGHEWSDDDGMPCRCDENE